MSLMRLCSRSCHNSVQRKTHRNTCTPAHLQAVHPQLGVCAQGQLPLRLTMAHALLLQAGYGRASDGVTRGTSYVAAKQQ